MTRETKIGLLVGLAFVIVVGILLSDHLTAATEPAAAPLHLAGESVRTSLGDATVADLGGVVQIPGAVQPAQPVPTAGELAAGRRPRMALTAMARGDATAPPTGLLPVTRTPAGRGDAPAAADAPAARKADGYKAEAGDTLGSIASKAMGANNKANRDLIVAANPALQANPNMIVAGHVYAVPAAAAARVTVAAAVAPAEPAAAEHHRHGRHVAAD